MRRLFAALCVLLLAPAAAAAKCRVQLSGVAFGAYEPLSAAPDDAMGSVTLRCTADEADALYSVALSAGAGSFAHRRMTGRGASLSYQLYADGAHTMVLGDGSAGTVLIRGMIPKDERSETFPVYGRIPPRQPAPPGAYDDTIVVTVAY